MVPPTPAEIAARLWAIMPDVPDRGRRLFGLCGPPAAGKSTIAAALTDVVAAEWGQDAVVVVPMDGFHLPDPVLSGRGVLDLKGAPETFDADGFCHRLIRLVTRPDRPHRLPLFDRSGDGRMEDALTVAPHHRLVIVEGNYLHLPSSPWSDARRHYARLVYLDVPRAVAEARLRRRFLGLGWEADAVDRKVTASDLPNYDLCQAAKHQADQVVDTHR